MNRSTMENGLRGLRLLAAGLGLAACAACGSLPDAGKLADASLQLRSAVQGVGSAVSAELRVADVRADATDTARAFTEAWQPTQTAADALAMYSLQLADIVKAGKEGGDTIRRLADAGEKLAGQLGVVVPPAAVLGAVTDLAASIGQQLATVRARQSLQSALEGMQPVVNDLVQVMARQVDDAAVVLEAANRKGALAIRREFADEVGYRDQLRNERKATAVAGLPPASAQRLEQIDRLEAAVNQRLEARERRLKDNQDRGRQGLQLVVAVRQALLDYGGAHAQLGAAVRESRQADAAALVQSVQDLRDLLKKVREAT